MKSNRTLSLKNLSRELETLSRWMHRDVYKNVNIVHRMDTLISCKNDSLSFLYFLKSGFSKVL